MGFQLQTKDFIRYFQEAREVIAAQRDYVTELDSTTGDGDHWVNVNMGFEKITALSKELEDMTLPAKLCWMYTVCMRCMTPCCRKS